MLKKNGDNKIELDKVAVLNFCLKFGIYVVIGLAAYFSTIGDIRTDIKINKMQLENVQATVKEIPRLVKSVDSLIIVLREE